MHICSNAKCLLDPLDATVSLTGYVQKQVYVSGILTMMSEYVQETTRNGMGYRNLPTPTTRSMMRHMTG